jgi:lysophospholipase-3
MRMTSWRRLVPFIAAVTVVGLAPSIASADSGREQSGGAAGPAPVVLFPAYNFTTIEARIDGQTTDPACPATGVFRMRAFAADPSTFSLVCQDELLTLRAGRSPGARRFREQPGVTVTIPDFGSTRSAPFYEPMYTALEAAGYHRDVDIRVAGYDFRKTPDLDGFLARTKRLIEQTSARNGGRPVHLVGHSNGPIYAQYLLTHVSDSWKRRFIHGFTPIAGNFPGQGVLYPVVFTGLNVDDFTFPFTPEKARSAAAMLQAAPSTYVSASDPSVIGNREVVVIDQSSGRSYTPADWPQLFADAGLPAVAALAARYIGSVPFAVPAAFPNVDVYAEKGSGIETAVGVSLPDLRSGQVLDARAVVLTRDGDINQEDLTNDAVEVWANMRCHHFSLTDSPGVDHFSLPSNAGLLARLIAAAAAPRTDCPDGSGHDD